MHASGVSAARLLLMVRVCVCACVRERERDRGRDRDTEIEGQRLTWEALAWKTAKVSKTREVLFFFFSFFLNMLASTSLEAPGQDLFYQTVSAISEMLLEQASSLP